MFSSRQFPGVANNGVGWAFTDRRDGHSRGTIGSLNLGRTDVDDIGDVRANFEVVRRALSLGPIVTLQQLHTPDVVVVDDEFMDGWSDCSHLGQDGGAAPLPVADALVTALPDVALCIRVADCVPVLLADEHAGVVAAAHAGRVGFDTGVLVNTVEAMRDLGASDIKSWIGPHVCGQCYEVPPSMSDEIGGRHPAALSRTPQGTAALDLGEGCQAQLTALGVAVSRQDPCTRTSPWLHSHRRDAEASGRLAGIIWRVSRRSFSDSAVPLG